jgi:hypothetical protein
LNIVCLKWGELYGPHYVNRLYNQCKKFIKLDFDFYCVTDDDNGLNENIKALDILKYQFKDGKYGGHIFTAEKIKVLADPIFEDKTLLLDLDLIILNDLTDYIENVNIDKVLFNRNNWQDDNKVMSNYFRADCKTNSGFVISKAKYAKQIEDELFGKWHDYYAFKYRSLDRTLEKMQYLFGYHDYKNLMYSYLGGAEFGIDMEQFKYRPEYKVCLFNNAREEYVNLEDNVLPWAKELWESYD